MMHHFTWVAMDDYIQYSPGLYSLLELSFTFFLLFSPCMVYWFSSLLSVSTPFFCRRVGPKHACKRVKFIITKIMFQDCQLCGKLYSNSILHVWFCGTSNRLFNKWLIWILSSSSITVAIIQVMRDPRRLLWCAQDCYIQDTCCYFITFIDSYVTAWPLLPLQGQACHDHLLDI